MKKISIAIVCALLCLSGTAGAQHFTYRVKAGFNIGGTSPLPLPEEIREIKSYSPTLALSIGAEAAYHFNERWGMKSGFLFENKGMSTHARVKCYKMAMNVSEGDEAGRAEGYFTGDVKTTVRNEYLTIPIAAIYNPQPRWELNAGVFMAFRLGGEFTGEAFDPDGKGEAYIRDRTPTGEKIGVTSATYNFSDDIRAFNFGFQAGANWRAIDKFSVYADFRMAVNSIFKSRFNTVSFEMYNIYLNIGFAYTF